MKQFILTLGLAAISAIGFGQQAPEPMLFAKEKSINPVLTLQSGTDYLMMASNNRLFGTTLTIVGGLAIANSYPGTGAKGAGYMFLAVGSIFNLSAMINDRKGRERLYIGMNGITVKLN